MVEETATLLWLANQACLEIHPWLSNVNSIDYPDFLVIDLDPSPDSTYEEVKQIALVTKELLDKLNLHSYLKTSGSAGLHIYVPIINEYTYSEVRSLGQQLASIICNVLPDIATIERSVSKRGRKVYVDYMQNVQGKTLSSVYSVRPPWCTCFCTFNVDRFIITHQKILILKIFWIVLNNMVICL